MAATGPDKDTAVGDVVVIKVGNKGPYGMELGPDRTGQGLVVISWQRLPDGKFSSVQKHGGVHIGDAIAYFNDTFLGSVAHKDAQALLDDQRTLKKELKFMGSSEYYRKKQGGTGISAAKVEAKDMFASIIRRARLSEDGKKQFTQYEIACQMRQPGARLANEKIYKWSVWKRYNEFQQLHEDMQRKYGWQVESITFPPTHTFVLDKFSDDFINRRKDELNAYWTQVMAVPDATDFFKHHHSEHLRAFLDIDGILAAGGTSEATESTDESVVTSGEGRKPLRRNSTGSNSSRTAARRRSAAAGGSASFFDEDTTSTPVTTTTPASPTASKSISSEVSTATSATARASIPLPVAAPAPTAVSAPTTSSGSTASVPPKASGARGALLADIARRRID